METVSSERKLSENQVEQYLLNNTIVMNYYKLQTASVWNITRK